MKEKEKCIMSILGEDGVGKHTIVNDLFEGRLSINSSHLGIDIIEYSLKNENNGKIIDIEFRIISGQERNKGITKSIYEDVDCFIIIYDVCNQESFKCINIWIDIIEKNSNLKDYLVCIIGNKISINRVVSIEEGKKFAENNNCLFYENDDKKNFKIIIKDIIPKLKKKKEGVILEKDDGIECCCKLCEDCKIM